MAEMITDYASLQTAIEGHLHRSNLTAMIPDFIAAGEGRIYDEMRVRAMETAYTATTAAATIPSGYLEFKWLYLDTSPRRKLERRDVEWIVGRDETGQPAYFARNADALVFHPSADATYNLVGCYYKRLAALSDTNTTNWLTTDYPMLILNAAMYEAALYSMDDERMPVWESRYQQAKQRIERADKAEQVSGSRLSTVRG